MAGQNLGFARFGPKPVGVVTVRPEMQDAYDASRGLGKYEGRGETFQQIADRVGKSRATVSKWVAMVEESIADERHRARAL
jgi:hypothetical protein